MELSGPWTTNWKSLLKGHNGICELCINDGVSCKNINIKIERNIKTGSVIEIALSQKY